MKTILLRRFRDNFHVSYGLHGSDFIRGCTTVRISERNKHSDQRKSWMFKKRDGDLLTPIEEFVLDRLSYFGISIEEFREMFNKRLDRRMRKS